MSSATDSTLLSSLPARALLGRLLAVRLSLIGGWAAGIVWLHWGLRIPIQLVPMGAAINEHCKQRGWPHVVMAGEQHDRISGTTRKTIYLNHHAAELLVVALGEEAAPAS